MTLLPKLGDTPRAVRSITGLKKSWLSLFLTLKPFAKNPIILTPNQQSAKHIGEDLKLLGINSVTFSSIHHRIYDPPNNLGNYTANLIQLLKSKEIIIIPLRALLLKVPKPYRLLEQTLIINNTSSINPSILMKTLSLLGYNRTHRVSIPGEFAVRGEIIDIFIHNKEFPVRIQCDFEKIEHMKTFDPENQRSLEVISEISIYPINPYSLNIKHIFNEVQQYWNQNYFDFSQKELTYDTFISKIHLFSLLLENESVSLLDYIDTDRPLLIHNSDSIEQVANTFYKEIDALYKESLRANSLVPMPQHILFSLEDIFSKNEPRIIHLSNFHSGLEDEFTHNIHYEESRSYFGNINFFKEEIQQLHQANYTIAIFSESEEQALRIHTLLGESANLTTIFPFELSCGFTLIEAKFIAICEHEIFGRKRRYSHHPTKRIEGSVIDSFIDLNSGDYIVHINYGIGLFKGIERIHTAGSERDYITLEYSDNDIVFVPIEQVNLIQRYIGSSGEKPRLDKIGSRSWSIKKQKAQKSAQELSEFLVKLYSRREALQGFSFSLKDPMLVNMEQEFESHFPYQETADQLTVMEEIKTDMEKQKPMDRLICGDVGYGKTELAMRSAFRSVLCGKQCAVLCPTTILAEQHYANFKKRFEKFSFIKIALLSRTVDRKTQKTILQNLSEGLIDIVIGTHRILSADLLFKNLGLLIVDEEQRFGVKDKERIKNLKTEVDCLTLSATPIPRTLHMSLVKIRDLSMLKTPPANRKPVETFINEFNTDIIANAIRKELERQGQVFYLHNRVESLESVKQFLKELVPEITIEMAHGKMSGHELDEIMYKFIHGGFQLLLSTTIIESGIDIPNVNTIIIDRADMYGVGQLYQLRGRVGRSDRMAYAYLLYPKQTALSELAIKRLQIINDFTELGSGFKIAMKDMEVRGAGNLLGSEQSGEIQAVGFDLYLKLLDEAIRLYKNETDPNSVEPYLELEYTGFIPDSYISSTMEKMEIYKKIAAISTHAELEGLHTELNDRFGNLPDEVFSLLSLAEIRILCRKLRISSIKERNGTAEIEFMKMQAININTLMRMIKESLGKLKPSPTNPTAIIMETGFIRLNEKSEFIKDKLQQIIS